MTSIEITHNGQIVAVLAGRRACVATVCLLTFLFVGTAVTVVTLFDAVAWLFT